MTADRILRILFACCVLLSPVAAGAQTALSGSIAATNEFHRVHAQLEYRLSNAVAQRTSLTAGLLDAEIGLGELKQAYGGLELHGRSEWDFQFSRALNLTAGTDFFGWFMSGEYRGPLPGGLEGDPSQRNPNAARGLVSIDTDFQVVRPGGSHVGSQGPLPFQGSSRPGRRVWARWRIASSR